MACMKEFPKSSRAARVTTSDLTAVVQRHRRQDAFKLHAATCQACKDPANELCEIGHRMLKEAMRVASDVRGK